MHILLIYPGGRRQDGLLLAGTRERMRVMMPGRADVVEYRLIQGAWMGESGPSVEIGAILEPPTLPGRLRRAAPIEPRDYLLSPEQDFQLSREPDFQLSRDREGAESSHSRPH